MVALPTTQGFLNKAILATAVLAGIGVAAGIATAPGETLEALLALLGVPQLIPTVLPVGVTTRVVLALVGGGLVAGLGALPVWFLRPGGAAAKPSRAADGDADADREAASLIPLSLAPPAVRRADAHPDAPPRRPIRASSDLGDPLPITAADVAGEPAAIEAPAAVAARPIEAPLPQDLDQPLAAFDPAAIPDTPQERPQVLAPLVTIVPAPEPDVAPVEPVASPAVVLEAPAGQPEPVDDDAEPAPAAPEESIADLLARLERGRAARRAAVALPVVAPEPPAETLDATLTRLRQLATR